MLLCSCTYTSTLIGLFTIFTFRLLAQPWIGVRDTGGSSGPHG